MLHPPLPSSPETTDIYSISHIGTSPQPTHKDLHSRPKHPSSTPLTQDQQCPVVHTASSQGTEVERPRRDQRDVVMGRREVHNDGVTL